MNIIDKAINIIENEEASFIIIKDNEIVYKGIGIGVSPIRKLIKEDSSLLNNAIIVDKIIGKAASMLLIPFNVTHIHSLVMSKSAVSILNEYNILATYNKLVDYIENRTKSGMCPLEESVKDTFDLNEAVINIEKTIEILMKNKNSK